MPHILEALLDHFVFSKQGLSIFTLTYNFALDSSKENIKILEVHFEHWFEN